MELFDFLLSLVLLESHNDFRVLWAEELIQCPLVTDAGQPVDRHDHPLEGPHVIQIVGRYVPGHPLDPAVVLQNNPGLVEPVL